MSCKQSLAVPLAIILLCGVVRTASAQWAVVDVGAIAQLVQQYATLEEQLTTMRNHLEQARQEYSALTGGRGMERLLAGTVRNYLPADSAALTAALSGANSSYSAFSSSARAFLDQNAVLTEDQLTRLSPVERAHVEAARHSTATLQALTQQALSSTSARFASLQQLIDAIASAQDPKAIFDLQARIQGEQTMLANDAEKLQVLFQTLTAEEGAQRQRRREQAIADVGSLDSLAPLHFPLPDAL